MCSWPVTWKKPEPRARDGNELELQLATNEMRFCVELVHSSWRQPTKQHSSQCWFWCHTWFYLAGRGTQHRKWPANLLPSKSGQFIRGLRSGSAARPTAKTNHSRPGREWPASRRAWKGQAGQHRFSSYLQKQATGKNLIRPTQVLLAQFNFWRELLTINQIGASARVSPHKERQNRASRG